MRGINRRSQGLSVLMLAILLGVVGGCSQKPLSPPNGWKVAQFPVWDDLRHSDAYLGHAVRLQALGL